VTGSMTSFRAGHGRPSRRKDARYRWGKGKGRRKKEGSNGRSASISRSSALRDPSSGVTESSGASHRVLKSAIIAAEEGVSPLAALSQRGADNAWKQSTGINYQSVRVA